MKKARLQLEELLQIAGKVERWEKHQPETDIQYGSLNKDNFVYEGSHKEVHVKLTYHYDPSPYEGSEIRCEISATFQDIKLGEKVYWSRHEEGTETSGGSKKIEELYQEIKRRFKNGQSKIRSKISKEAAIRYARSLLK